MNSYILNKNKTKQKKMADKKILIIGGTSYIGTYLLNRLSDKAISTYYEKPIDNSLYFDALSMRLSDVLKSPETISHAVVLIGDTDPETCAEDIKKSTKLNVDSIKSIIKDLQLLKIKPVFTSSEFVFDGTKGNYIETDTPNPILTYGKQKVEIEKYIQKSCDDFIIVRLAKVFGSQTGDETLFTNWLEAIKKDQTIHCAYDQIFSPVYVKDVVEAVARLIENDCKGIFHVSNPRAFSRLDLLNILLAEVKKKNKEIKANVVKCSIHDFDLREKRPLNVSMKPDKLIKNTGIQLTNIEDICKGIVKNNFN